MLLPSLLSFWLASIPIHCSIPSSASIVEIGKDIVGGNGVTGRGNYFVP
jgi:hypothetical protein